MTNATTIGNTRFDLRLVLFSLGFKYLGWKVMSPAVLCWTVLLPLGSIYY